VAHEETAMTDDRSLPIDHEPLNRAERRAQRYHPNAGQPDPHGVLANPTDASVDTRAGLEGEDPGAVTVSGGRGDVTHMTSPGTGGATESGTRQPHHEGAHFGNQPNS
jgi:hypothetical protein